MAEFRRRAALGNLNTSDIPAYEPEPSPLHGSNHSIAIAPKFSVDDFGVRLILSDNLILRQSFIFSLQLTLRFIS